MQTELDLVSLEQAKKMKKLGFDWLDIGCNVYFQTFHDSCFTIDGKNCFVYSYIRELESNDYGHPTYKDKEEDVKEIKEVVIVNNCAVSGLETNNRFLKSKIMLIQPTIALALKWFEACKNIIYQITFLFNDAVDTGVIYEITAYEYKKDYEVIQIISYKEHKTRKAAETALLDTLIEYVEKLEGK